MQFTCELMESTKAELLKQVGHHLRMRMYTNEAIYWKLHHNVGWAPRIWHNLL